MASEPEKMETNNSEPIETPSPLITINVKTPKDKKAIKVEPNASIKEFKAKISAAFNNIPVEQLCLIFAGKMLKASRFPHRCSSLQLTIFLFTLLQVSISESNTMNVLRFQACFLRIW